MESFIYQDKKYRCYLESEKLVVCLGDDIVATRKYHDSLIEYICTHSNYLLLHGKWAYSHYITYEGLFSGEDFFHCADIDCVSLSYDGSHVNVGYPNHFGTKTYPTDNFFKNKDKILSECLRAYQPIMWEDAKKKSRILFNELCKLAPYEGVVYDIEVNSREDCNFEDISPPEDLHLVSIKVTGMNSGSDYTGLYNPSSHIIAMLREPIPEPPREGSYVKEHLYEVTEFQKILYYMVTGCSWDEFDSVCDHNSPEVNLLFTFTFSDRVIGINIKTHFVTRENYPTPGMNCLCLKREVPVYITLSSQPRN
jgi:hypothetical protein